MQYTTWIEISKEALLHNLKQYKTLLHSNLLLYPVLKSNAYGHGIELVGRVCQESMLINGICVASLSEALLLRKNKITKPILVISIIDDDPVQALLYDIALVAYDVTLIEQLNSMGQRLHKKAKIHLKIDTGFSRSGILVKEAFSFIKKINSFSHISLEGIFSHYADSADNIAFTHQQYNQFHTLLNTLEKNNITIPYKHISNSAAIPFAQFNKSVSLVRLGIGTYGLWPSEKNKKATIKKFPSFFLKPALTWKTKIIQKKTIPAHSYVGYGLSYKTDKPKTIGLLPIGYWDGYDRKLSNCGVVKIGNYYAPVIGRISMNLTIIDITEIPAPFLAEDVILLGSFERVSANELAHSIGTINYEVITRINPLITRILVN